jgi:hypothetical protein
VVGAGLQVWGGGGTWALRNEDDGKKRGRGVRVGQRSRDDQAQEEKDEEGGESGHVAAHGQVVGGDGAAAAALERMQEERRRKHTAQGQPLLLGALRTGFQ